LRPVAPEGYIAGQRETKERVVEEQLVLANVEPHRRAIAAYAAVVRAMATMTTVEDVLRAVATQLCDLVGADRCSIYLKEEDTGIFRGQVGHARIDIDGRVRQLIAGVEADRFTREIIETGQPVVVTDARIDPRPVRSTVRNWDIRSMLGLPLMRDNEVIGLAFVDDEAATHCFIDADYEAAAAFGQLAGGAVSQALSTVGARANLRAVTRQNQLLRRAAALDERLTRLAVDGGGLEEILSVVAERTGKPIAVLDEAHRTVTVAPAAESGAFLRAELEHWRKPELARLKAVDDEPTVSGPFPERGIHYRFLLAPVRARQTALGHVVMAEVGAPLSALDRHAVRRAAAMVALELSAERRVVAAERDSREALLSDLLRGDRDRAWLLRRGAGLGLDLGTSHVVCLVGGPSPEAPPDAAGLAGRIGARLGLESVPATALADAVALLLPADRLSLPTLRDAIAEVLGTPGAGAPRLIASLSEPVSCPEDVVHAHQEACQVLRCVRALAADGSTQVLSAHQLGAARIFLSSVDRREAESFARRALGPLLGDGVGGELLDTLQEFFVCGRGLRLTATALGVHENTIRYRFAKVKELSGLDIYGDADDQTTALLALRVLQLQGARPWGTATADRTRVAATRPAVRTS
jgi:sugar diacid utilization regulator/GAF domain-containing protein